MSVYQGPYPRCRWGKTSKPCRLHIDPNEVASVLFAFARVVVPRMMMMMAVPSPVVYERGFSFFSFHRASRPTPETLTTLNRTPGISPLALPLRPKPARRTSSFSSTKFKQPSLGTGGVESQPSDTGISLGRIDTVRMLLLLF